MRSIGRLLQYVGLMIPPISMTIQLLPVRGPVRNGVAGMLLMLVIAVCLFGIGRIVEGYARGRP